MQLLELFELLKKIKREMNTFASSKRKTKSKTSASCFARACWLAMLSLGSFLQRATKSLGKQESSSKEKS